MAKIIILTINKLRMHINLPVKVRFSATGGSRDGGTGNNMVVGRSLEFYVLATHKVISGWVTTGDSGHSWRLYSAAALGHQATSTMT